jgi:hypothetical protein
MDTSKMKTGTREMEGAEFGVDSRYASNKDRLSDGKALMEARLKRMNDVSGEKVLWAKLTQLKLQMDREPKLEFLLRLMIHSEQVFRNICPFNHDTWFKVYYHERISETLSRQKQWRPEEEMHVHISEPMVTYGNLLG